MLPVRNRKPSRAAFEIETCCDCCPIDEGESDSDEPCGGCECAHVFVSGVSAALVSVESADESMSEEVMVEFALWSRTLTPRVVQLDLLRPPKA